MQWGVKIITIKLGLGCKAGYIYRLIWYNINNNVDDTYCSLVLVDNITMSQY